MGIILAKRIGRQIVYSEWMQDAGMPGCGLLIDLSCPFFFAAQVTHLHEVVIPQISANRLWLWIEPATLHVAKSEKSSKIDAMRPTSITKEPETDRRIEDATRHDKGPVWGTFSQGQEAEILSNLPWERWGVIGRRGRRIVHLCRGRCQTRSHHCSIINRSWVVRTVFYALGAWDCIRSPVRFVTLPNLSRK